MFPFGYLPSVCNPSPNTWANALQVPTCVEMQAHLPDWEQDGSECMRKNDTKLHGISLDGSVIRADYIVPKGERFIDYTLCELASQGWGATGYDMVHHVEFVGCDCGVHD